MASGVKVEEKVIRVFQDMKVRKCSTPEEMKKRKKAVIFCMSADNKQIIVEEGKEILVGDCDSLDDVFLHFVSMFPKEDCRYALYDATYETKETKKEDLVFIMWAPDCAPLKRKMIFASSKDGLKKQFGGIKHEYQANNLEDLLDRCCFAQKLGGSMVKTLEGKPV